MRPKFDQEMQEMVYEKYANLLEDRKKQFDSHHNIIYLQCATSYMLSQFTTERDDNYLKFRELSK